MPGPYTMEAAAQAAAAIDTALGTSAAKDDNTLKDLVLDWMTGVVALLQAQQTEITTLQNNLATLQSQVIAKG